MVSHLDCDMVIFFCFMVWTAAPELWYCAAMVLSYMQYVISHCPAEKYNFYPKKDGIGKYAAPLMHLSPFMVPFHMCKHPLYRH